MGDGYHELAHVHEVADAQAFSISRAKQLHDALKYQRDFTVLSLLQRHRRGEKDGEGAWEFLVVDVECDGVPPKNTVGIQYRERLALCVPEDPKQLVVVLALRRSFPVLMHQNQGEPDGPASLCLYFEPTPAVHRTWTPQKFLRRIQWWLEKSARGELHASDQPAEQLFFASPYELVLPWNLEALREDRALRFLLSRREERLARGDGGFTVFLEARRKDVRVEAGTSEPIELSLPAIVHGFVERDPLTLGQLADMLSRRGADLLPVLIDALQARVGEQGALASLDQSTVILLHIPISRAVGELPTKVTRRAFITLSGGLELGVAAGALFKQDKRYFSAAGLLSPEPAVAWRELPIFAMEILQANDSHAARMQSGVTQAGPRSVLIGAGSLGSAMLELWSRCAWGEWTVIDKDHIRPHNLSRHVAFTQHIGRPKAEVVAELNEAIMNGATRVVALNADACDFALPAVSDALAGNELVIDASTTLEYPRAASAVDGFARHISVFITPSGNDCVLLAEDARRDARLRTLEAQYYRALVQHDWGSAHLAGNAGTFWSGASCRDISMVLPYSRISSHAGTLAEQIPAVSAAENAVIRIWQRDPLRGDVVVRDVLVHPERRMSFGKHDLFFDDGLEQQLRAFRARELPNETGGVLLGYHDFNVGALVVVAALPAPADSKSERASFERGVAGLADAVAEASRRTAGVLAYVGEWHSHPQGHCATPSGDDLIQLVHLALGMSSDGLPAVQLIVGEHDLQIIQGAVR